MPELPYPLYISCIQHPIPTWEGATALVRGLPNMDSLTPSSNTMALNSLAIMRPSLLALVQVKSNLNSQAIQLRDSSKLSKLRNNSHGIPDTLNTTSSLPRISFPNSSLFRPDSLLSSKPLHRKQVKPPRK